VLLAEEHAFEKLSLFFSISISVIWASDWINNLVDLCWSLVFWAAER
jgi:hypothetical protein